MWMETGIGYCGLACCVCSENENCKGCKNEGCQGKDWCKNYDCCRKKGLNGCWECDESPCDGGMLDKIRVCAFSDFVKVYGEEKLSFCLKRNEQAGMSYHDAGKLTGDYDIPESEDEIIKLILNGKSV